jgi:hypothetical protein
MANPAISSDFLFESLAVWTEYKTGGFQNIKNTLDNFILDTAELLLKINHWNGHLVSFFKRICVRAGISMTSHATEP